MSTTEQLMATLTGADDSLIVQIAKAAQSVQNLLGEARGSVSIKISNNEWSDVPDVKCSVWGKTGARLAKESGVKPGAWYGFESNYVYQEVGRPQRNYCWEVGGVSFSYIEDHKQAGITFEQAAAANEKSQEAE